MRNWAGNHEYRAGRVHRPATLAETRAIVARAPRLRVLGSRHSFSDVADSDELLLLDGLPADVVVDRAAGTVSFGAALTYGGLAEALRAEGLALHNLASLPHISVGGAIATATHGSGDGSGNLATAVAAVELVTSGGELVRLARSEPDFDGVVVGLGAVGAVTRVTLGVEPAYEVAQRVFEGLAWDVLLARFDEVMASGTSVSVFTTWDAAAVDQVWVKRRAGGGLDAPGDLFGAVPATVERHPILGVDPVSCTPQLGVPGPWADRLPHFRMGFTPSSGKELQSEYFVPRPHAVDAILAIQRLGPRITPHLFISEIRAIDADALWMSPCYKQPSIALHFTWKQDWPAVSQLLPIIERELAPFSVRPHWGKLFTLAPAVLQARYEQLDAFRRLMTEYDPRGKFQNAFLKHNLTATRSFD
jgi:xylitol oxidase